MVTCLFVGLNDEACLHVCICYYDNVEFETLVIELITVIHCVRVLFL